jgi:hypothetical protein
MRNLYKRAIVASSLLSSFYLLASDISVNIIKQSDWDSGFCATVQVLNSSDNKIEWHVQFDAQGLITNLWNANYTQNSDTLEVEASGVDWNKYVEPHSLVEFGYCANKVQESASSSNEISSDALSVIQTDNASWDGGFCKNVIVKNNTSYDIDWEVEFNTTGVIYNSWNANISQDVNTLVVKANGVDWNNIVKANSQVEFGYCANTKETTTQSTTDTTTNEDSTQTETNTQTNTDTTLQESNETLANEIDFNSSYSDVLPLALKFYEAQRAAGPFPTVTWRKAAALDDGSDVGRDLSGGWFDAGDHVKFNLPMSYSATMLNWGILAFEEAYRATNTLDYAKEQVKYALDYFMQAYNEGEDPNSAADDKVYYQVGDPYKDHAFWGPPHLMTMERPTYTCDAQNKCSEVSAGMAAALASGALVFKSDEVYASTLLETAKKIYRFAKEYQGNNGYTAANNFYTSFSGYYDELAWAAIWLYKATKENSYLEDAKYFISQAQDGRYWAHSWDNVSNGTNILLFEATRESSYADAIETHLNYWLNGVTYTSGGLAFLDRWGSLRYASTTSFIALLYAKDLTPSLLQNQYINFAKGQIDYILGDNPRGSSYVVGYGNNYPKNPHHRASHNSLTNDINNPTNNEFLLEGALVGGPKSADDFDYADDRTDYVANEVATDYNAGFTGALAGLIFLQNLLQN